MKDVGKRQFVQRRGGVLWYRRRYPKKIHGKTVNGRPLGREFLRSLGVSKFEQLAGPYEKIQAEFNRIVAAATAGVARTKSAKTLSEQLALAEGFALKRQQVFAVVAPWFSQLWDVAPGLLAAERSEAFAIECENEAAALLDPDDDEARAQIDQWVEIELSRHGFSAEEQAAMSPAVADLMARAKVHALRRDAALARNRKPPETYDPEVRRLLDGSQPHASSSGRARRTFGELLDRYMKERAEEARSDKTLLTDEMLQRTLLQFFGASAPLGDIDVEKCREFRDLVVKLPPNAAKYYPKLPLRDIPARAETDGRAPMSIKNAEKYIARLKAIFAYAHEVEGWIGRNPAASIKLKGKKSVASTKYVPFTADELSVLFHSPIFTGCRDAKDGAMKRGSTVPNQSARYWVPLIGLFTGMRQAEICQLDAADIRQLYGIWVISVTDEDLVNKDKRSDKSLKTEAAKRDIPIHPELERLGLVRFAKHRQDMGERKLFSEFRSGKYPDQFQKWFGRLLKVRNVKRPRLVFHSFRHGFRDAMAKAGIDVGKMSALAGWEPPTGMAYRYGSGEGLNELKNLVVKIDFGDVTRHLDGFPEHVK